MPWQRDGWSAEAIASFICEPALELAVACLEMGRFAKRVAAPGNPVGDPGDHLPGADAGKAEQLMAALGVAQDGVGAFRALEDYGPIQSSAEFHGDAPHTEK